MAITVTVLEAAEYTFEANAAPTVSIEGGLGFARLEVNVGVNIADAQEGTVRNEVNVGVDIADEQLGTVRNEENVGVNLADDRNAYVRDEMGDVNTLTPTPHIWFVWPEHGRPGQEVTIVGHGFGATQVTHDDARALLNELEMGIISWAQVAGTADALNANRQIERGPPHTVTPEHQEIQATVPPNAESGLIFVDHNDPDA